ncbi:MAG: alpha/beta fold hydrolase [Chloroflexota bacterium]
MRTRRPMRHLGAVALAIAAFVAVPANSLAAATPDPVLLIHGWQSDGSAWAVMVQRFADLDGRTVVAVTLPGNDNIVNGRYIRDRVAALKSDDPAWAHLDIVGVSMGGLSARYYLKSLNGTARVDAYASLGTPQYGIWPACLLFQSAGGQMCPTSSFLKALNLGDDTPGSVRYMTLWGAADTTVPQSATRLDGGACYATVPNVVHTAYEEDANVFSAVVQAIDGGDGWCPGTFK